MPHALQSQVLPSDQWTGVEKWVWEKICNGEVADFNDKLGKVPDPKTNDGWTDERLLSPLFIESVLLYEPYRGGLPRRGFRVNGAWIKEELLLTNASISAEWWMDCSRFESSIDLSSLQSDNFISLENSFIAHEFDLSSANFEKSFNLSGTVVSGTLKMDSFSTRGSMFMRASIIENDLIMAGVKIGGQLDMGDIKVTGLLDMDSVSVTEHLFLRQKAELKTVNLISARIGGILDLSGIKVSELMSLNQILLEGSLFIKDGSVFKKIDMVGAKIGGVVDMSGIKISESLMMSNISAGSSLILAENAECKNIDLSNAKITGLCDFSGSKLTGDLNMNSISVDGALFLSGGAEFNNINLGSAKISNAIDMEGVKVTGMLDMDKLTSGSSLYMRNGAEFNEIKMIAINISGQLSLSGAKVSGELNMNSILVGGAVFMNSNNEFGIAEFNEIDLSYSKVGGALDLSGAKIKKQIHLDGVSINQFLSFTNCEFEDRISLVDANINGNVFLTAGKISNLNLGGAKIYGELQFNNPGWVKNSFVNLCNSHIGSLQDGGRNSWPDELDLDGLSCSRLGGIWEKKSKEENIADRDAKWFVSWLAKDKSFSPQPYLHIAGILNSMGHSEKANAILYAAKNRERNEAFQLGLIWKWIGLSILNWTIGYGFGARYFRSLIWVVALTLIGVFVLGTVDSMKYKTMGYKTGFSLDLLLPIIELNDKYKLDFSGWQLTYFYFHELMGFLLGSFVLAGLSGITKK